MCMCVCERGKWGSTQTVYRTEYLTRSGRLISNPIHPLEDLLPCCWLIHGLLLTMGFRLPISIYSTPPLLFFFFFSPPSSLLLFDIPLRIPPFRGRLWAHRVAHR
ncbi:hypothetical protein H101_07837 [Trichophyton interdigitale H6]|nr:hypothetical protein H101_07837 [Trichophyton interdigitale H6]